MPHSDTIESILRFLHIEADSSSVLARLVLTAVVVLLSFTAFYISRRLVKGILGNLAKRTTVTWDDAVMNSGLFARLTLLVPALICRFFLPTLLGGAQRALEIAVGAFNLYFIIVGVMVGDAVINALHDIYRTFRVSREIPLKGFAQVLKIVLFGTGLILMIAVLMHRSPIYLLSGLGALTAVLMLVFKDPILGFAGGIQLISNRMLRDGDWIEMPRYGADGDVQEINLTTVKVRNWDNTITTIPTYALINDSFKNWRGMQESQGRRIKRAIYIDMNSICFCTPEMLSRFAAIDYIADYIAHKNREVAETNARLGKQDPNPANTRRLTNIGTFRAYALAYLKRHPLIHSGMTLMVRQLAPTPHGLPLEIYAFSRNKEWGAMEKLQADIFDHLLAIVPTFGLKIYQYPAGSDLSGWRDVAPAVLSEQ
jgi:miniconductance mechanosensitive channel